ncbi:type III-B CRISPR module RAMP protein Cmr1 [Thermococcus indicus]|uniref:Type III-B CRISPR module RAMP protein Cmr1 n=1 Tax=Thermococcus indicus TaxID=2586643 RepID=A0A4Y5SNS3_9EURY|nr:type III-B CRISPR module RAMP protein Cmr1 [Thermococcus indicus]QDA31650.1 type III-B CRISPR module RAMP protein Cmr1 [Thermococcus indicus]
MYRAEFELETITPLFMRGADQSKAEFRPASVKGVMRWWFRALTHAVLLGNVGEKDALSIVKGLESKLFGSTGQRSRVLIRTSFKKKGEVDVRELGARYLSFGLSGGGLVGTARIELLSHKREYLEMAKVVAEVAFAFGGLGARTTRGMGSVQPLGEGVTPLYLKNVYQSAVEVVGDYFGYNLNRASKAELPEFPALHPRFFRVKLGSEKYTVPYGSGSALSAIEREFHRFRHSGPEHERMIKGRWISYRITAQYDAVKKAYNGDSNVELPYSAFGLPHQYNFFSSNVRGLMIEGEVHGRRASPVRFKVVRDSNGKYRVMIIYLKYRFLPADERLKVRIRRNTLAKGIPQPDYSAVERFVGNFSGLEVFQ